MMDNLSDLLSSLSQEDMDALKNAAGSLLRGGDEPGEGKNEAPPEKGNGGFNLSPDDLKMVMKMKKAMETMNQGDDQRSQLLHALKPYLSPKRQGRADEAVRLLRLMELFPMFKELF